MLIARPRDAGLDDGDTTMRRSTIFAGG